MKNAQNIRQDLTQALVAIVSQGIQNNQLDDAENVINLLKILCPEWTLIDEFAPYIAIKRGNPLEAMQMYMNMPAETSKWYSMMALCLKLTGDPTWQGHATRALELNDSGAQSSHSLANVLLGLSDVGNGIQNSDRATCSTLPVARDHDTFALFPTHYLSV